MDIEEEYADRHLEVEDDMKDETDNMLKYVLAALALIVTIAKRDISISAKRRLISNAIFRMYMGDIKGAMREYIKNLITDGTLWEIEMLENFVSGKIVGKSPAAILREFLSENLIEKRNLEEWLKRGYRTDLYRIMQIVQNAQLDGWSDDEIEEAVRDYFKKVPTNNVKALMDAATFSSLGKLRLEILEKNVKEIELLRWISTLDDRTTNGCIARADQLYTSKDKMPVGHNLIWEEPGRYHWRCRSYVIPAFYNEQ